MTDPISSPYSVADFSQFASGSELASSSMMILVVFLIMPVPLYSLPTTKSSEGIKTKA